MNSIDIMTILIQSVDWGNANGRMLKTFRHGIPVFTVYDYDAYIEGNF